MKEIDIVFNIDYKNSNDVHSLFMDIPKYIEFIQVNNVEQFNRLIKLLDDDVKCYIWVHPSFSADRVEKGFQSKVVSESIPILEKLNMEFTKITRSTGKTNEKGFYDVSSMLELKSKGMKSYTAKELKAILKSEDLNKLRDEVKLSSSSVKILFIAASPEDQDMLNAGIEQRKIDEALRASTLRDNFQLISKTGAKLNTFSVELLKTRPDFVHFTGHGDDSCIALEHDNGQTHEVPKEALERLFKTLKENIRCVILSACYSSGQAEAISKNDIYVIGMNNSVCVSDATAFANGFYQAIGEGQDIKTSFELGQVHYLSSCDKDNQNIPELWFQGKKISD